MGSSPSSTQNDGAVGGRRANPSSEIYPRQELKQKVIVQSKSNAMIVAAIDFGTTYSGYAYSFTANPGEILTNYWDQVSVKTPTVVLLDPNQKFHSFGDDARKKYEQLIKANTHKEWYLFDRFKMKLFQKGAPLQKDMDIEDTFGKPMKAINVFSAAIKHIKDHLLGVLTDPERDEPLDIKPDKDIRWVLTVPAIWNDLSKRFMREAANQAGIPGQMLLLALEPEAASLFCKRELGTDMLPVGCRYMVLDLGGGTADITCHEVKSDGSLKELHPPTGGAFGGTNVDNSFIDVLVKIFGADVINRFKSYSINEYWELMNAFELKKRKFEGRGREILKIPVQLMEMYRKIVGESVQDSMVNSNMKNDIEFKQGKVFMTETLMKEIFSSALTEIKSKTAELTQSVPNISRIILVGGFSESLYLQNEMKEMFVNVCIPNEPAAAVIKGAVMYGHETKAISSRKCRYTYGIAQMMRYNPDIHHGRKIVIMGEHLYCDDVFSKHIEIGTEVSVDTPEKARTIEYFPSVAQQTQAVLEVFKSRRRNPVFVDEEDCEFVGLIKIDIDPRGDIQSKLKVKLIFGGTELYIEVIDEKNGTLTTGSVDFSG